MPLDASIALRRARPDSDARFASLIDGAGWQSLAPHVRRRFSRPAAEGETTVYEGIVVSMIHSRLGAMLASFARLLGGPLPLAGPAGGRAVVVVTEDARAGGQIWTRVYARAGRFPQTVNSVKQFRGPTGLLEDLGLGLHMYLDVGVEAGALVFRNRGYGLGLGRHLLPLPRLALPIACEVRHEPVDETTFDFVLEVTAPGLGTLIHQRCRFRDPLAAAQ